MLSNGFLLQKSTDFDSHLEDFSLLYSPVTMAVMIKPISALSIRSPIPIKGDNV